MAEQWGLNDYSGFYPVPAGSGPIHQLL